MIRRVMSDLHTLLRGPIDMKSVAAFLDDQSHASRLAAALDLSAAEQAALYDAARGFAPVTVNDMVPPSVGPMVPVVHWGRNSLAAFRRFQKVMCRPDDTDAAAKGELWGYNNQAMGAFTGPGYYVAYDLPAGEVLIDYTRIPPRGAPGWPRVLPNSARLSRFIYFNTQDTMRRVSKHVTIGRASREGKDMPNWFVLVREDVGAA
jgi:hypothetical protein